MVKPLGFGLIGCGGMGRSLGRQLVTLEGVRLAGVYDPDESARREAAAELGAGEHATPESLAAAEEVDALVIASPPATHRQLAELGAAHGRHLFVEKPLAPSIEDCDAIAAAAGRAGLLLMVGQVLRFYPTWWKALALVREGVLGKILGVSVSRIGPGWSGWPQPWRRTLAGCGGLLMEVNSHEIDFLCQVGGDVDRVYAEAEHYLDEDGCDYPNLYFISLRFRSGGRGLLHSSTLSTLGDLSGKIQGDEGTLFYTDGFSPNGMLRWQRRDEEPRELCVADIEKEHPVREELRLFAEAIRTGSPSPIPAAEGRRNVAIALAAYESARLGRPISPGDY